MSESSFILYISLLPALIYLFLWTKTNQDSIDEVSRIVNYPLTEAHINPLTKEIKYILKGEVGPTEITNLPSGIRRMVRYIPYSEYLASIAEKEG